MSGSFVGKHTPRIDSYPRQGYSGYPGALSPNNSLNSGPAFIWMRGYTSYQTANFKRVKQRDLPANVFYSYTFVLKDSRGQVQRKSDNFIWEGYGQKVMSTSLSALKAIDQNGSYSTQVMNDALMMCMKRMGNINFNAAQAFAERKQTANMLIKTVNRFVTFAVLFRKGNFKAANKILAGRDGLFGAKSVLLPKRKREFLTREHFANAWLEYSYGWKPLVGDIYGAAALLAESYSVRRPQRATATKIFTRVENLSYGPTEGLRGTGSVTSVYSAKCVLYWEVASYTRDRLKSTGLTNPALLAWELLPYSFCIDWILPVGTYLEAVGASTGLEFVKGSNSLRTTWNGSATSSSDNSIYRLTGSFSAQLEAAQLYRVKYLAFPSVPLPSFRMGLNLPQVTSAISLLQQLFTGKVTRR